MNQLFLIDENLSKKLVLKLKEFGYLVKSVGDINLRGADDIKIIGWAIKNNAIIITGDLWHWNYRGKIGIIVLRMKSYKIDTQYKAIEFLHKNNILTNKKIKNSLVISTLSKYRIREG